jgi:glutamate-5-semialdehyde dehydrogenase
MRENNPHNDGPLEAMGLAAKKASYALANAGSESRKTLLLTMADALEERAEFLLAANARDLAAARQAGLADSLLDRLALDPARLSDLAGDVRAVAALRDPVGEVLDGRVLDNGLSLLRRRVPLGVVAVIYEARPNVTVDVSSLCLKTGNAVILRGGKETAASNAALVEVIRESLCASSLPPDAVQAIVSPDRSLVSALLRLDAYVDMLIPRGGAGLHRLCREESRIPVISGGIGVCHIVVDAGVDFTKALRVVENAKIQRPSACNAVETLLVLESIAPAFLPLVARSMAAHGAVLHASAKAMPFLAGGSSATIVPVRPEDYDREWLSRDLNVHVVPSLDAALSHIREHGTGHSEAILTENMAAADRFVAEVDAAAVYVNADTRFTDGGQFGLGAEVAISTQKLHARGPMGLDALTTYKWIGRGDYTIRA